MISKAILAIVAGPLILLSVAAQGQETVPRVGMDGPDLDACAAIGSVVGINQLGKDYLAVRKEPDQYAREKDQLAPATLVWLCDAQGDWQGIVYPTGEFQKLGDCRVSTPVATPGPYAGPCQFGWVIARNLSLVTG